MVTRRRHLRSERAERRAAPGDGGGRSASHRCDLLLQALAGHDVASCRILTAATARMAGRPCGAFDFVTLAGELLSRHGVYTGGY